MVEEKLLLSFVDYLRNFDETAWNRPMLLNDDLMITMNFPSCQRHRSKNRIFFMRPNILRKINSNRREKYASFLSPSDIINEFH
jgi:hypothetical protein